jgi:DGQHR domain-containing protein
MISVAALRMQQFGVQFYQASLTAKDIDKLVRFEVLSYGEHGKAPGTRGAAKQSKVHWDLLERRIASSEKAYQRQIIRKKIDELVAYFEQCRMARDLPSIAGAVIISCDEPLKFEPVPGDSALGILKVPEREGILRAIDGQHRLLALHADMSQFEGENFNVPAVIFDRLPEDHVVQMFVTINAKHTRLNASHLVSLSGRQLYRDDSLAAAHDVVRALNDREDSPLYGEIKLLGVGKGRVAQAPLAQELKKLFRPTRSGRAAKATRSATRRGASSSTTSGRWRSSSAPHGTAASTASSPRRRCARSSGWRPRSCSGSTSSTPIGRTSGPSAASSRRGAAASAISGSRPPALETLELHRRPARRSRSPFSRRRDGLEQGRRHKAEGRSAGTR